LEQNLGAHTEETIDNPEGEDHWHTINEPVITMLTELQLLMGKNALTDSRTTAVMRPKAARQPPGSVHESLANTAERGIRTPADPAGCHAWKGCNTPVVVGHKSLEGARSLALLMCN
jgi:hypothetical protein